MRLGNDWSRHQYQTRRFYGGKMMNRDARLAEVEEKIELYLEYRNPEYPPPDGPIPTLYDVILAIEYFRHALSFGS